MSLTEYKSGTTFPGVIGRTPDVSKPAWPEPNRGEWRGRQKGRGIRVDGSNIGLLHLASASCPVFFTRHPTLDPLFMEFIYGSLNSNSARA
jgi:hypothetical protein